MNKQRKLTWIEKKQIERIAFDHPFFDMHGTVLSKKEAKAIIRSTETRKSGIEIVSEACDRVGIPRPDSVDNRSSIFDNLKEVFSIPVARRIGIIAIALILLVVFFTATSTGRAIAETVIQYFATLFENGSIAVSRSDNAATIIHIENEDYLGNDEEDKSDDMENRVLLNTIEDFIKTTGKDPFVLPLPYIELYYEYDQMIDYLALYITYETSAGEIVTYQIWNIEDVVTTTSTGYTEYDADGTIYYSIEETGNIAVRKMFNDSYLGLVSKGSFSLNDLIEMLKDS